MFVCCMGKQELFHRGQTIRQRKVKTHQPGKTRPLTDMPGRKATRKDMMTLRAHLMPEGD
jgi:hypothetical protein